MSIWNQLQEEFRIPDLITKRNQISVSLTAQSGGSNAACWCYVTNLSPPFILRFYCVFLIWLISAEMVAHRRQRRFPFVQVASWWICGLSAPSPHGLSSPLEFSVINENSITSLLIYDNFFICLSTNPFHLHDCAPLTPSLSIKVLKKPFKNPEQSLSVL